MRARLAQKLRKRAISQNNKDFSYSFLSQLTNNETFYEDKLKWTKIFEDANCPAIPVPDMTPIKYTVQERKKNLMSILQKKRSTK